MMPCLVPPEGRTRRHLRGTGCDGRSSCLQANGTRAYGQAVWSCPLDAGVKFAVMMAGDGGYQARDSGESTEQP